jgi:hypothetical protein
VNVTGWPEFTVLADFVMVVVVGNGPAACATPVIATVVAASAAATNALMKM